MQEKNKKKKINNNIFISKSLEDTLRFAYDLAKEAMPGDIFCLDGDLGVGKTVIAKGMGNFFNVNEEITSPTFTILKSYKTNNKLINKINHFDLYRINSVEELINIGFDDYINEKKSISIIEWPNICYDLIEGNIINIKISKNVDNNNLREISVIKKI